MEIIAAVVVLFIIVFLAWRWQRGRAARAGREGERRVARQLARLPRRFYTVISDVLLPSGPTGATTQIDHIVVSTRGVFVIETKRLSGAIRGSEHAQNWTQTTPHGEERTFYNPLLQNEGHIRALRKLMPELDPGLFVSMVVFTDARTLDISVDDFVEERTLLPDKRVSRTLIPALARRHWWQCGSRPVLDDSKIITGLFGLLPEIKRRKPLIDRDEVEMIVDDIVRCNDRSRRSRHEHTEYVKKVGREVARDISRGICPRCGGRLEKRKGAYGRFLGCENYPTCRFTTKAD